MVMWPEPSHQNPPGKEVPAVPEACQPWGHLWATMEGETDPECEGTGPGDLAGPESESPLCRCGSCQGHSLVSEPAGDTPRVDLGLQSEACGRR